VAIVGAAAPAQHREPGEAFPEGEVLERELLGVPHVELLGLYHARKLAVHQVAIDRLGWDAVHARLGLTRRFYERFVPAISARDFALRAGRDLDRALDLVAVLRP